MSLLAQDRKRNESSALSVSSSNRFSVISKDSSSSAHSSSQGQINSSSSSTSSTGHISFGPGIDRDSFKGNIDLSTIDSQPKNGPSKLVKRNSLRLAKRISSSSLLPSNYSNKKKPLSERDPTRRKDAGFISSVIVPFVMALKDTLMARKGYWLRNGAILVFGLTIFFFVMVPRNKSSPHDLAIDSLHDTSRSWPAHITSDHCTLAHPGRPLIQYVLMIDAGSSGSRIHAYKFNYCKATPELEGEMFDHIEPGLSSYDDDADSAAKSLDQLLNKALKTVPEYLHKSTPVALKATAGLRLLGDAKSEKILSTIRKRIETNYPFPIIKEQGVAVMDGADEGVYAWVTVNYLLDRFNSLQKKSTVAILDLGGASTQVVFEPRLVDGHSVAQAAHRFPMTFNGNDYALFQHSYLGYGLFQARSQINHYVVENPIKNTHGVVLGENEFAHPCMPVRSRTEFQTDAGRDVILVGVSDLGGECRAVVEAIFYKQKTCSLSPCSFNGVYQPSLQKAFADDIYAFSFFFDRTAPFRLGSNAPAQDMTVQELEELTDRVCAADETDFTEFASSAEASKEVKKLAEMCMDLSYIYGLLEFGYGIPKDRRLQLAKKLKGYETGWCLGASIAVLEERDWFIAA